MKNAYYNKINVSILKCDFSCILKCQKRTLCEGALIKVFICEHCLGGLLIKSL